MKKIIKYIDFNEHEFNEWCMSVIINKYENHYPNCDCGCGGSVYIINYKMK